MNIKELGKELGKKVKTQSDVKDIMKDLMGSLLETALNAELDDHLGYSKNEKSSTRKTNTRNGNSSKTLKGDRGEIEIDVPRDRDSSFAPQIVPKGKTRIEGFEDQILALYSRGMTTRDIQEVLKEMYNANISHSVISNVTEAVIDEVEEWQNRSLARISHRVSRDEKCGLESILFT